MKLVLALPLVLAAVLTASPAFAFPQINVIGSETISTVPPRYKTTFTLELVGYTPPGAWIGFFLESSGQGAPVTFYDTEDPGYPWGSENTPEYALYSVDGGGIQGLLQFSVTTDQQVPCVKITILDALLGKAPTRQVQSNYVILGCLAVDMPTPAGSTSWGRIKGIYR